MRRTEGKFNPVTERKRDEKYVLPRALKRGDEVLIVSLGRKAVVTDANVKGGKVEVQAGIIKTKAEITDLELREDNAAEQLNKKQTSYRMMVSRDFRDEIDLRGKTGDEAWGAVDKYLDEAQLSGFSSVRVMHSTV